MEEKKERVWTYDIDGLMELMKPYKISTDDVEEYDKKRDNRDKCTFISIYRCYPKTHTTLEFCKEKNQHGDIITMSDKVFRSCIPGLYQYSKDTIDIIQKWQKGHSMILEIDKQLIKMNILSIEKVSEFVTNIMDAESIEKHVDNNDTEIINITKLKEMIKDGSQSGRIEISNI